GPHGPQGPQGPQGHDGSLGERGPAGPTPPPYAITQVKGEPFFVGGDQFVTRTIACPAGTTAISAGVSMPAQDTHCYTATLWRNDDRTYEIVVGCNILYAANVTPEVICLQNA
ncbi:MAG TPA: hypothetical protein VFX03_12420, partial [Thermomicrobiales bacterium]|nr:hypothetical protein [Thermomicrobiales bacterium]